MPKNRQSEGKVRAEPRLLATTNIAEKQDRSHEPIVNTMVESSHHEPSFSNRFHAGPKGSDANRTKFAAVKSGARQQNWIPELAGEDAGSLNGIFHERIESPSREHVHTA